MLFFVKKKALPSKKLTAFKFTDKMRYATDGYIPSLRLRKVRCYVTIECVYFLVNVMKRPQVLTRNGF